MFEPPTKFSKGEGLGRISVFRGGLLGKRSEFFQEKKLRYLTTRKVFLSVITKNLNWKILTKNLVTFKRWDVVKDEKF